jgi:hypothetical protein
LFLLCNSTTGSDRSSSNQPNKPAAGEDVDEENKISKKEMSTSESSDNPPLAEKHDAYTIEEMENNKVSSVVVSDSKDDRSNREEKKVSDQQKIRRPRGFKVNTNIRLTFRQKSWLLSFQNPI